MVLRTSLSAVQGLSVCCSGSLDMLFKVSRYAAQGFSACCSRSLCMLENVRGLGSPPGISFCLPKRIRNENGAWPNPFLIIIYARVGVCLLCLVVSHASFSLPVFSIAPSSSVGGGQQDAVGQRRGSRAGVSRQQPCVRRSTRAWLLPAC